MLQDFKEVQYSPWNFVARIDAERISQGGWLPVRKNVVG
jgi:hypothetical protein